MKKNDPYEFQIDLVNGHQRDDTSVRTQLTGGLELALIINDIRVEKGVYKVTVEKVMTPAECGQ